MEAIVEQVRVSNTKSGRATVVLSFVLGNYGDEFRNLAQEVGSTVLFSVEPIAHQLEFGDDPNEGLPEGVQKVWEGRGGDVLGPHAYEADADGKFCSKCGWPHAHPAHEMPTMAARLLDDLAVDYPERPVPAENGA